jgi:CopG family nickel-responsive transcriptional regulator
MWAMLPINFNIFNISIFQKHFHLPDIIATTHVHMEKHICLEVVVLRGKVKNVRKLADHIKAIKGVKHGDLVTTKSSI